MLQRIIKFLTDGLTSIVRRPRWAFVALAVVCLVGLSATEVWARVGGGGSYGGGGGGGGGGGEGIGAVIYIIFQLLRVLVWLTIEYPAIGIPLDILVAAAIIWWLVKGKNSQPSANITVSNVAPARVNVEQAWSRLRRFDPNFSEIIFTDFCYALYGRAQHERAGKMDLLSPYLSDEARKTLLKRNPSDLVEVAGIIVGSMQVSDVRGLDTTTVEITVTFESNYTEVTKQNRDHGGMTYYLREQWVLERRRDVLSPRPETATALHCPKCGAALMKDTNGACAFCGSKIENGEFQWFVRSIALTSREVRGPLLTTTVEEVGTDLPSVVQANFAAIKQQFELANPTFTWGEFTTRAKLIFNELQAAWSTLDWERARPHETDSIFQMHQYWIEAYKRQNLRNVLDNYQITRMQPCKIMRDEFYDAITLRIGAQGNDYTIDERTGQVVTGSKSKVRTWTEYWTFVRYRHAAESKARDGLNCPNCGAALKVSTTGICEYCHGKITSGEFDWVLSKIEQDESYQG
ncbi:MAG: TIM44-like domain-containing protein [Pyrinomonadaceae bacterium]